jgi:hypothetical protein
MGLKCELERRRKGGLSPNLEEFPCNVFECIFLTKINNLSARSVPGINQVIATKDFVNIRSEERKIRGT